MNTNITIEIEAHIALGGMTERELYNHLNHTTFNAIGNGLLTGDNEAEVDEHSLVVTVNRHQIEDEIYRFVQGQLEDGYMDLEGMARRIARYGLMLPSQFVEEMNERADNAASDDAAA
jgi:hypothetical protein